MVAGARLSTTRNPLLDQEWSFLACLHFRTNPFWSSQGLQEDVYATRVALPALPPSPRREYNIVGVT